jgi:fascin 1/2
MTTAAAGETLQWSLGLINAAGKYLTAETFQHKTICASSSMKRKQIFFLEAVEGQSYVRIRTCLGCYLSVDDDGGFHGNVAAEDKEQDSTGFIIEAQADGKWALKSQKMGWYVKSTGETMSAFTTEITAESVFTVHLAMHPQICIKNQQRKAYMHLNDHGNAIHTDELIPWGHDATITLVFFPDSGTYGLQTSNGHYLESSGKLSAEPNPSTAFILCYDGAFISFKALDNGKFLTSLGAAGVCKAAGASVGPASLYEFEDSFPQIKLTASNAKKVSIKGGVEVAASNTETTDTETFQVEPQGGKWSIKCSTRKFWTCGADTAGGVMATAEAVTGDTELFTIEWRNDKVALVGSNGKYVRRLANSYLKASEDEATEDCLFVWEMVNRPLLILRGEYGFIGTLPSGLVQCNKSVPEVYNMHITKGVAAISAPGGGHWATKTDASVTATGSKAEAHYLELHPDSKLAVKNAEGKYLQGAQNGDLTFSADGIGKNSLFEY